LLKVKMKHKSKIAFQIVIICVSVLLSSTQAYQVLNKSKG